MTTDTLIADAIVTIRNPAVHRLLEDVPKLGPEHRWEGEFEGTSGAAKDSRIKVEARIAFHGALIEGVGRCVNFPADLPAATANLTLSGTLDGEGVDFQLWFGGEPIGNVPLVVSGQLSGDGREMSGSWSIACFSGSECGCSGGGGTWSLRRVD